MPARPRAVNRRWIGGFFQTELGQRLREGQGVLREFKFSILEDGQILEERLAGEELLLQGVVDCCLMEDDGITILDFKTDRIRPGEEAAAAARYAGQVRTYGQALSRIFEKPVKRLLLYFFQTGRLQEVFEVKYEKEDWFELALTFGAFYIITETSRNTESHFKWNGSSPCIGTQVGFAVQIFATPKNNRRHML
ncbi:MAG: PD-(D/E)XK nuclease family protein [Oscillospiraceae bacterium]